MTPDEMFIVKYTKTQDAKRKQADSERAWTTAFGTNIAVTPGGVSGGMIRS